MASRSNLMRAQPLPSQQVRGFAFLNPSELSSEDDWFSNSSESLEDSDGASNKERSGDNDDEERREDGDGDGAGGDVHPVASLLKLPLFFTSHNLLLVNMQNEAERQATQQQQQNYEAVMKRFQVRRVAVRAFSTSNVTAGRPPLNSGHSSTAQRRRETDPVVAAKRADALECGELPPNQQQNANASADTSDPQQAPSPERGASFRSIGGETSRRSSPDPGTKRAKSKGYTHSYPPGPQRPTRFTLHQFLVKKKRRMLRRLRRFATNLNSVIYPTSTFQRVREGVLFNLFVVQLVCLPLLPIYFPKRELIMTLQIVAEWICFADCVLGFNTAYFKKTTNEPAIARREIARHYACCGWFGLDLLSSVPVNTVTYLASDGKGLFKLSTLAYLIFDNIARTPRFVSFFCMIWALRAAARALCVGQNFWAWALLYSCYSHLLRIARLMFLIMLLEHYMAELQDRIHRFFTHLWQEYGSVDTDLVKFPKELTPTLALEVGLCQYMNLVTGVPRWKDCSPGFVSQVIRNLVVRVYLPDDFVLRQREISQDLSMINRGTCERAHPLSEAESLDLRTMSATFGSRQTSSFTSPPKPLHSPPKKNSKCHHSIRETADSSSLPYSPELLRPGQVFGGMGLLLNFKQHFNVRAVTHVEMCVLSRYEFQKILTRSSAIV